MSIYRNDYDSSSIGAGAIYVQTPYYGYPNTAPSPSVIAELMKGQKHMSGQKPLVVCGGEVKEAKDMDDAQAIAESLAHSKSADAYILKPVKKVAPKRDVVTTEL